MRADVMNQDAEHEHCGKTTTTTNAAEEYYATVKRTAASSTKSTRLELPERLAETVAALDTLRSFKKQFVGFTTVLTLLLRQKTVQHRKNSLLEMKSNPRAVKSAKSHHGNFLSRTSAVPDSIRRCVSAAAKAAVAMFCLQPYKETIRRDVLFAVLEDSFDTVDDIVKLATGGNVRNIRETVDGKTSCSDERRKSLIRTLLETSDVLHDKSLSRLAMAVHPNTYLQAVKFYVDKNQFATICPYDALINRYVQTCIASKSQAFEREKIANQFEVNACAIVENMINSLPEPVQTAASKSVKFEDGRVYYVFEGPTNFPRDLTYAYRKFNGKHYQIVTYKDCLYDVIGTEDELFYNKTWPERLETIDYSAKIIIETKLGAELNEYYGNATLATTWMEDGRSHSKHHTFVRRDKKSNSSSSSSSSSNNGRPTKTT